MASASHVGSSSRPDLLEEAIDVYEPHARHQPLPAHPLELLQQETQQIDLQLVGRREVGVPALGRKRLPAPPVPEEPGFAEAGAGGDHPPVAGGVRRTRVQLEHVLRSEHRDSVGVGLEIVQQPGPGDAQMAGEVARVHHPGKVRGLTAAVLHRPRHPHTGEVHRGPVPRHERLDDFVEGLVVAAREGLLDVRLAAAARLEEGQDGLRAADIAREDHGGGRNRNRKPARAPESARECFEQRAAAPASQAVWSSCRA